MTGSMIGYARCSTDQQDLTAQGRTLIGLGVAEDRIYLGCGEIGAKGAVGRISDRRPAVRGPSRDPPRWAGCRSAITIEIQDGHQVLLVTGAEVDQLPDTAWQQLVDLDFPEGPGRLRWDPYAQRWRVVKVLKD